MSTASDSAFSGALIRPLLRRIAAASLLALASLTPGAALAVDVLISSFTDNPDPALRGGPITYTITTENSDADTAHNVVVSFPLPAETQFVSVADTVVAGACSHDGAVPGVVTCTYPSLLGTLASPAGPTRTINVVLKTTGATVTTLNSTVTVSTTDVDTNPANNSLGQNTTITNAADLSATMTGAPNPATGGGLVTWTVAGSNLGPNTSGSITYTTNLPSVLTYVVAGSGGSGWTCPSTVVTTVTCTRAAQAVGSYPALAIVTRLTGVASGTVTLAGNLTSTVGDPDSTNNTPTASVTVNPGTDLTITQDPPTPNPAVSSNNVTFVLRPSNLGPNAATAGATVTFPLPSGFTVATATGSTGWSCTSSGSPPIVTCTFAGSFAASASGVLTIVATTPVVSTPTPYANITASIAPNSGGPADPVSSNNTATSSVTISPDGVDLSLSKTKSPSPVAINANMTSSIVVANAGPRTAASGTIVVTDALDPAFEQYISSSGTNWSCTSAPPNVSCTYNAALGVGNSSTLAIVTRALAAGTATNNATAAYSGSPGDYNASNNAIAASATVTDVNNSPDLLTTLTATTAGGVQTTVEVNETQLTYTVAVTNQNSTTASAKDIVIRLNPVGRKTTTTVTVATAITNTSGNSNATFTCTGGGTGSTANIACTQTSGTFLAPGDVATLTVTTTRPLTESTNVNATASAVSTSQGDPNPADNSATVAITIDPIADVEAVSDLLTASTVLAGTNATYTITLRNNGPSPAAAMSLADQFTIPGGDSGFTFVSVTPSSGGVCSGLVAGTVYASGSPTLNCAWSGTTAVNGTRTATVVVRPNWQAGSTPRTLGNTATVSTTTAEDGVGGQGTAANSKSVTLTINPAQVDLLINNTDSPDPLGYDGVTASNNDVTYTVAVTNGGPSLASGTGFTFTMTPPAGKTITFRGDGASAGVAAANPTGTIPGSLCNQLGSSVTGSATLTVTCTTAGLGQIASGATATRYLVFRVVSPPNTGGDVYNTNATVFGNETDTNPANDSEAEGTTVRVRADLSIAKTPSSPNVQIREPFTWNVVVTNGGPGDSQTTGLTDTLPTGMVFGSTAPTWTKSSGGTGTCTVAGQTATCAFGLLPASQTVTVTVPARVTTLPVGGTTQNCATATTSEVDPNNTNNLSVCASVAVQSSSLAGTVFQDRDRSSGNAGTPQAASVEPRIASVTVQLAGTDAYGNSVAQTTTTDVNGAYSFTALSPAGVGGYTLTETQPTGYVNGPVDPPAPAAGGTYARGGASGNSSYATVVLAGNTAGSGYDFPEVRRPTLGGFVYVDLNLNNVRDSGTDGAVAGATVRLLDAGTLVVIATTTTASNGAYAFANLDPLTVYTLEEPLPTSPAGLGNGPVNPGLINGAACASGCVAQPNVPSAGTDRIASIDLGAGVDGTAFNFGEQQIGAISGVVFVDTNRDGIRGAGETGRIAGVTLRLVQGADCTSGTTLQTTTTPTTGAYRFDNVVASQNYLVCETQPVGYGTGSANGVLNSNVIPLVALASGETANNDFGETLGSIAGSVYQDSGAGTPGNANNGVRDAGEPGIAGVPITLTGTDSFGTAVSRSAVTDAGGNYLFDGLFPSGPGGYTVVEGAIPSSAGTFANGRNTVGSQGGNTAIVDTFSGVVMPAGVQATGYLFGELPIAPITGTVYIDRDRNGTMSPTPTDGRASGVTITLYAGTTCGGTVVATTTTDASGNYSFSGAPAGQTYTLCRAQPTGYGSGPATPASGGTSSAPNAITLAALSTNGSQGNLFAVTLASIAGSVYQDNGAGNPANANNGARNPGEPGITGVTITATGVDATGTAVNRSAVTDSNGDFLFTDLLAPDASGYRLAEGPIPPSAGTFANGLNTAGTAGGSTAVTDVISAIAVGAGVPATGYLFGELPVATLSGTVYLDRDRDGAMSPAPIDGRIAGVTVTLRAGSTCSGSVVATTTTDANGAYTFASATVGQTWTLCESQPVGYGNGTANPAVGATSSGPHAITVAALPAAGSTGNNFGERAGSIAGVVFLDANNDGIRQSSDTGIAGVAVVLSGSDAAGNAVGRTATSDANGAWQFDDLLASGSGGYTVTAQSAQPVTAGVTTVNGLTTAGTVGGSASGTATPPTTTPSAIAGIALPAGADSIANRFAKIVPVGIAGNVFVDVNNDGVQTLPGDVGIAAVALAITGIDDLGGAVSRTIATAADGSFRIADLRPGTYTVTETTQPVGTVNGLTVAGSAGGTATAVAVLPSAVSGIVLTTPGTQATGYRFAELGNTGVLSGRVWLDANNNGIVDTGEPGIAGVAIELTGTDASGAAVRRTTTTDANGAYTFDMLAPGTYSLRQPTQPAATVNGRTIAGAAGGTPTSVATTPSAIDGIALTAGRTSAGNLFGELPAATISGRVYADNNDNGVFDSGESGLAGVTLTLTGSDDTGAAVNRSAITAADGSYTFDTLRPGLYAVVESTQPAGTVNGATTVGPLGGTPTTRAVTPSAITALTLPPGGQATNNNFAEIGSSPDLVVAKDHSPVRFTVANAGTYRIRVRNAGDVATSGSYTVTDRLPAGIALATPPAGNGWTCSGATGATSFSCTSSTVLAPGATALDAISATVAVSVQAATASPVNNVVLVEGGGENDARKPTAGERDLFANNPAGLAPCNTAIVGNACRDETVVQQAASLSGTVWSDIGSAPSVLDGADRRLPGWQVEVVDPANGSVVGRAVTAADGSYRIADLLPGVVYAVRFRDPQSQVVFGYPVNGEAAPASSGVSCDQAHALAAGSASSCATRSGDPQLTVVLAPGQNLAQQSLPVDPSGVVYDSGVRQPVAGSVVTLTPIGACSGWNPATGIVGATLGGYVVTGTGISMTTGVDGFYQFLFASSAPASCRFSLSVAPASGYTFASTAIPAQPGTLTAPGAAGTTYAVQPQAGAPTGAIGPATAYYLALATGSAAASIIHNHIPVDAALPGGLTLSKTGDRQVAEIGDTVRYAVTVQLTSGALPRQVTVLDRLPAGFTFVKGTAMVNGATAPDPVGAPGPTLLFNLGAMPQSGQQVLQYRLRVGVGSQQGDGTNRARAYACGVPGGCVGAGFAPLAGSLATNEGRHHVRVSGGVFATEACVVGKIFVDCNDDQIQDEGEPGIPGVRLVFQDGTTLISDSEGKYSYCGLPPKSAVLKVDAKTLPAGARLVPSSNRNLDDPGSLWLDLKNGELHRADFVEGTCAAPVVEQVRSRREQGETRAPALVPKGAAIRFESKGRPPSKGAPPSDAAATAPGGDDATR